MRQKARLEAVFTDDAHIAVELCWSVYQRLTAAYAHPDRRRGKTMMTTIINTLRNGVPDALEELAQLGRTLHRRRADILAYFDHHASNGPTEAINGRLEALRRNALGFRNRRTLKPEEPSSTRTPISKLVVSKWTHFGMTPLASFASPGLRCMGTAGGETEGLDRYKPAGA